MNNPETRGGSHSAILFIIWPFMSAVAALKNYDRPWAKNLFWAFIAFYGFTFAIGAENSDTDIVRYIAGFQAMYGVHYSFSEIMALFFESGGFDIIKPLISILLSRFTESQAIFTLVYGIIFGYFFSRNMWYVLNRLEGRLLPVTVLLLCCLFLVNPIWNMNGWRMWTAAHVFIFGLLPYLFEGKKNGLWISALSLLFHFSFIVPVAVLGIYLISGNRLTLYFIFFTVSIFISEIDLKVVNDIVNSYAPEVVREKSASYRGEAYVESFRQDDPSSTTNWYAVLYTKALNWAVMGLLVVIFLKARVFIKENRAWLNLYSFTLLFYGVANLLSSLPSGGRFLVVANLCALALAVLYVQNFPHEKVTKRFIIGTVPLLLLFIVVTIRIGFYSMSATAIFGNPLVALFTAGENVSLNDFLRMLL